MENQPRMNASHLAKLNRLEQRAARERAEKLEEEKWVAENPITVGTIYRDLDRHRQTTFLKVIGVSACKVKCQAITPAQVMEPTIRNVANSSAYYEYWKISPSNPDNTLGRIVQKNKACFRYLGSVLETDVLEETRYIDRD